MKTDRFMCLGCGGYWSMGVNPTHCPYCGDTYYTDNIIPSIPTPLTNVRVDFPCGHAMSTDVGKDVEFCPQCGQKGGKVYAHEADHLSLKDWQEEQLKIFIPCE